MLDAMKHASRARFRDSVVKNPFGRFSGPLCFWFRFQPFTLNRPTSQGPGVVPPEGDLHWPPCFAVFSLKGERPKPNSRAQKKDHENEYEKYKIGTQEPARTVEHWKPTKD
jgi:hypothetical protein